MYRYIGVDKNMEPGKFTFLVPLFAKGNSYFRSIIDGLSGRILSFSEIDLDPAEIKPPEHHDKDYYTENDPALYAFYCKDEVFAATKDDINKRLIEALRYGGLSSLEKYDIYFFWGDRSKIREAIDEFLQDWPKDIITADNFLMPFTISLRLEDMADCIFQISRMLGFRSDTFDYEKMFRPQEDGYVSFLNYQIPIDNVRGNFDRLIANYTSHEYKDLIVHCFKQNYLADSAVLKNPEFRFRILVPNSLAEEDSTPADMALVGNTKGISGNDVFHALERAHELEKKIAEQQDKPDEPAIPATPQQKQQLAARINKIKMQPA
jgi:hypothetical protein